MENKILRLLLLILTDNRGKENIVIVEDKTKDKDKVYDQHKDKDREEFYYFYQIQNLNRAEAVSYKILVSNNNTSYLTIL